MATVIIDQSEIRYGTDSSTWCSMGFNSTENAVSFNNHVFFGSTADTSITCSIAEDIIFDAGSGESGKDITFQAKTISFATAFGIEGDFTTTGDINLGNGSTDSLFIDCATLEISGATTFIDSVNVGAEVLTINTKDGDDETGFFMKRYINTTNTADGDLYAASMNNSSAVFNEASATIAAGEGAASTLKLTGAPTSIYTGFNLLVWHSASASIAGEGSLASGYYRSTVIDSYNSTTSVATFASTDSFLDPSTSGNKWFLMKDIYTGVFFDDTANHSDPSLKIVKTSQHIGKDPATINTTLINAVGKSFQAQSDRRLKTNVRVIEDPLSVINRIRGVRYTWKENQEEDIGVIAQEVQKVLPEIVKGDSSETAKKENYLRLDYSRLTTVLVEANKALQKKNQDLEERVVDLERSKDSLESRLEALERGWLRSLLPW